MIVTTQKKIETLAYAVSVLLCYREHLDGCEVDHTEFCTCGMKQAADYARAAVQLEVEP